MAKVDATDNSFQNLYNDGTLNTSGMLDDLFDEISEEDEVYFPDGIYLFPEDYAYDFGGVSIIFQGESREGTIFTTYDGSSGISMRTPPRIDITKAPPQEGGIYYVDTVGEVLDDFFDTYTPSAQIGDYIEITSADPPTASIVTLEDVKNENYITYVDATV